jgi:hypothetical protein
MKAGKANVLDATRAQALQDKERRFEARRVQVINSQARLLEREKAVKERRAKEEEDLCRQREEAARKYLQYQRELQEVRQRKEREAERERQAGLKAVAEAERLEQARLEKERQAADNSQRATRRFELALEKQRILLSKNEHEEARMTAYARKNFLETVATEERQKASSYAERKQQQAQQQAPDEPLERPKYIAVRGPVDYSRTCLHNPLVQELEAEIESAVQKAEAEARRMAEFREQRQRASLERERSAEKRGHEAMELIRREKEYRAFEEEQREK